MSMKGIMTQPAAATVIIVDEAQGASMSEIANLTGRALSTMQRAVETLIDAGVLRHTTPRGPVVFRPDAPKRAIREIAEWTLGGAAAGRLAADASRLGESRKGQLPPTVKSRAVREYLPGAIGRIVETYDPSRVILFGSQARGDAQLDSDVDLLVLFDPAHYQRGLEAQIARTLKDAPFAKDVLVRSSDDPARASVGTAVADAFHDGLVLYER
jgi:predicted nucleotidyltransferase